MWILGVLCVFLFVWCGIGSIIVYFTLRDGVIVTIEDIPLMIFGTFIAPFGMILWAFMKCCIWMDNILKRFKGMVIFTK